MSYDAIYTIANQGMILEKLRVDVAANNIANQHHLAGKSGLPFTPMQVVATSAPDAVSLVPLNIPPNRVYEPHSPLADNQGYVNYPGVSTLDDLLTLRASSQAYEANIRVINAAHALYLETLTIGNAS